jgi:chromosome segregation ATPase
MTSFRYFLARITHTLGIHRRSQRMSDAASETHLLRDAETYLGAMIWENVENIEPLSGGYWNLRKLTQEKEALASELSACQEKLNKAHEHRASTLSSLSGPLQRLIAEKAELSAQLEELAERRNEIVATAIEIRKTYDGLKVKAEVLSNQTGGSHSERDRLSESMNQLKERFAELKAERTLISEKIVTRDLESRDLDVRILSHKTSQHENATKAIHLIGDATKEISSLRAGCGIIDTRMAQLHTEIGKHVSRNFLADPACAEAAKNHRGLVSVLHALRKSITLNYRLAEM